MYQKYHTTGIVLRSYEVGETDRLIVLLTRDFGLVHARASAVRTEVSKMRYALQRFTLSRVSLVKGKRGWRVAGASAINVFPSSTPGIHAYARIAELALRLVRGEERHDRLYDTLAEVREALAVRAANDVPTVEVLGAARLLFTLGYLSDEALGSTVVSHALMTDDSLAEASRVQDAILASINRALSESHL